MWPLLVEILEPRRQYLPHLIEQGEVVEPYASLFNRSNQPLDHAILLRSVWADTLLLYPIAIDRAREAPAVGIIIGAAFGKIVTQLVSGVIMPPIGVILGGVDFSDLAYVIKEATADSEAVVISYGAFVQTVIDFTIIAFAIFLLIKGINSLKREEAEPEPEPGPSAEAELLMEIRDLLKTQG